MKIDCSAKYLVILLAVFLVDCSSFPVSERFEGLAEGKTNFRVYVKIDAYEFESLKEQKKINEKLNGAACSRFSDLITGTASGMEDKGKAGDLNLFLAKKDVKPELVYRKVSEEKIEAFMDFTVPEKYAAMISSALPLVKSGTDENE